MITYLPTLSVFRKNMVQGLEKGGAYSVYHKGELVVDLWGGFANELSEWPWQRDTVTKLFSSSKGPGAIAVAVLVDRCNLCFTNFISTQVIVYYFV